MQRSKKGTRMSSVLAVEAEDVPKAEGAPKAKAKSLADLFGSKAKKKPKAKTKSNVK